VWKMKKYYVEWREKKHHSVKRRKANWIDHILRRNCLLKIVIEDKLEGKGRLGRRPKQLLDYFKEKRRYWNLKEVALDCTLWRTRFGRSYWLVARQITYNEGRLVSHFEDTCQNVPPETAFYSDSKIIKKSVKLPPLHNTSKLPCLCRSYFYTFLQCWARTHGICPHSTGGI
jgi:hypothetical protein